MKKSSSSKQWLRRHVTDPYVHRAKKEGYRARSAYKLTEIDDRDRFLRPGQLVVDLGAAPGGWSQVAAKRIGATGRVVGIDLLPVESMAGVEFIQGDFAASRGLGELRRLIQDEPVDVVLSDMAPNMSGIQVSDQARVMHLAEISRDFAVQHLHPEGVFLVKVFQGAGYDEYLKSLRNLFQKVLVRKPGASRAESAEQFLLARGLKNRPATP